MKGFLTELPKLLKEIDASQAESSGDWQTTAQELSRLSFNDFAKRVGYPPHVLTQEPTPFAPFQLAYVDTIERMQKRYHKFHLNKSRQSGWSALHLYIIAWRGFNKYAGQQCRIVAGNRSTITAKLITRLKAIFRSIPEVVDEKKSRDDLILTLRNGTVYEGLPANPVASTGDTQIRAWLLDESTKWKLIDDQPVMNSIMPLVRSNHADCFMISTPDGPRGFFWELDTKNRNEDEWFYYKSNIWATEGYLYTKQEIEKMLADPTIDAAQEYLNQYTMGRNSIFGNQFTADNFEAEEF